MRTKTLWLRNTSRYSDAEVWPLVKAAYESVERSVGPGRTMPRIIVKLTNCRGAYRGRASWTEWHLPKGGKAGVDPRVQWERVLVRIGGPQHFPHKVRYPRFKSDMPEYDCNNYREGIVMVAAHEMEHCLGASGRQRGEFRCEMSAWDAIDYYRKHQAEIDGGIAAVADRVNQRVAIKAARALVRNRPDVLAAKKLATAEAALAKWTRKQTIAKNKVKKYARTVKRLKAKLTVMQPEAEPLALAANTTPTEGQQV